MVFKKYLFFILVILYSCDFEERRVISEETYGGIIEAILDDIENEDHHARFSNRTVVDDLHTPVKAKRRFLLGCYNKIDTARKELDLLINRIHGQKNKDTEYWESVKDSMTFFVTLWEEELGNISEIIIQNIDNHAQTLGFEKSRADAYVSRISEIPSTFRKKVNRGQNREYRQADIPLEFLLLQSYVRKALQGYEEVLKYLVYAGSHDGFDVYFPVVIESDSDEKTIGDSLNLLIGIGYYSSMINPQETEIIVDEDTLNIKNDGTANYRKGISKLGRDSLKIECVLSNTLTGEVITGELYYFYRIK